MIVLDTHAWVWWLAEPRRLGARARAAIAAAQEIGIAAISTWELAMLVERDRVTLDRDPLTWVRQALAQPRCSLLPLTPDIAVRSVALAMHGDPADRIIVATSLDQRAALVTKDRQMRKCGLVETVW